MWAATGWCFTRTSKELILSLLSSKNKHLQIQSKTFQLLNIFLFRLRTKLMSILHPRKRFDCWKIFSNCRTALKLKHPKKLRHFLRQTLKMSIWDGLGTLFSRKKWNPLARDFFHDLFLWKRRYQRGNGPKCFQSLKLRFKVLFLRSENTKKDFLTSWKKFQILLSIF